MNFCFYSGFVMDKSEDIKIRKAPNGDDVTSFTLKVRRSYSYKGKNLDKQKDSSNYDYITITAWNQLAHFCARTLDLDMIVEVTGSTRIDRRQVKSIKTVEYNDGQIEDGFSMPTHEVVAKHIEILGVNSSYSAQNFDKALAKELDCNG